MTSVGNQLRLTCCTVQGSDEVAVSLLSDSVSPLRKEDVGVLICDSQDNNPFLSILMPYKQLH